MTIVVNMNHTAGVGSTGEHEGILSDSEYPYARLFCMPS